MSTQKINDGPVVGSHDRRRWVSPAHKPDLQKRAGLAYVRLDASGEEVKVAIGVTHHTSVTHRKAGLGPLANLLAEIDGLERRGICTDCIVASIIETQLDARGAVGGICTRALSDEEQSLDHAEDLAQHRALAKDPDGARAWRDSLLRYITFAQRAVVSLGRVA